ncbi:MAG: hypothetical protein MJ252_29950 [archaeon]|nr:hypothetical protein [archaeon]
MDLSKESIKMFHDLMASLSDEEYKRMLQDLNDVAFERGEGNLGKKKRHKKPNNFVCKAGEKIPESVEEEEKNLQPAKENLRKISDVKNKNCFIHRESMDDPNYRNKGDENNSGYSLGDLCEAQRCLEDITERNNMDNDRLRNFNDKEYEAFFAACFGTQKGSNYNGNERKQSGDYDYSVGGAQ